MPFNYPIPRSFNLSSVREFAPPMSGVYGLSSGAWWIYIGETDNIQGALLQLLQGEHASMVGDRRPTGFVFEICDRLMRCLRQDRLVSEYEPVCNRRWSSRY